MESDLALPLDSRAVWNALGPTVGMSACLVVQVVQNLPAMQETWVRSLSQENPLEKEMATHSSILAWESRWTEEPGGYNPWSHIRVGHDLETKQQKKWSRVFTQISTQD